VPRLGGWVATLAALAAAVWPVGSAQGRTLTAAAVPGEAARAIAAAAAGDTVVLGGGAHAGPLRVDRSIVLRGAPGAALAGGGHGTIVRISAPGVVVEDLEIRDSGRRVLTIDSGIQVLSAGDVTLRRLRMREVLYGIYAERAPRLRVEGCTLTGRVRPMDELGEGNGIHLWYSDGAVLRDNTIRRFLDAIYLSFANHMTAEGNRLSNSGRYGFHTMYCQDNRLIGNRFERNLAGCAVMFSNHLRVERNAFVHNRGPRTYGLLLRDCSGGVFVDNQMVDNTVAVFMDNSNRNRLRGNLVQDNGWGLLMFSSCAGNQVAGNAFINNDYPVALDMRRTDNRFDDGRRGNFWSDHAAYDLDGDGLSDVPYSPVSAFAFLSKQYPDLSVLAKSPAVAALGVAEHAFPALRPSEAVDRHPLVHPPVLAGGRGTETVRLARADWTGALGFGLLGAIGTFGLVAARRRP
jgi:nitrous oxidase accessory protein